MRLSVLIHTGCRVCIPKLNFVQANISIEYSQAKYCQVMHISVTLHNMKEDEKKKLLVLSFIVHHLHYTYDISNERKCTYIYSYGITATELNGASCIHRRASSLPPRNCHEPRWNPRFSLAVKVNKHWPTEPVGLLNKTT